MDTITVLRCADTGARAGKHIGADGVSAKIETKTNFTFRTVPVRDFDSFVGAMAEVERDPLEYLIRGEPTDLALAEKAAGGDRPPPDRVRSGLLRQRAARAALVAGRQRRHAAA